MPEVSRTTREIRTTEDRYTLNLSADEFSAILEALAYKGGRTASSLGSALEEVLHDPEPQPAPLADGDQLRITSDRAGSAIGHCPLIATKGDTVTVLNATPDSDGDMEVQDTDGHRGYLAAAGRYAQWERVAGESTPAPLAVGDRIRILRDGLDGARVEDGDVLTVESVDACGQFTTDAPTRRDGGGCWFFELDAEGEGWERVGLRRIAKGDHVRLLKSVGHYAAGRTLSVTEDPNRYRNFNARALYMSTVLLSEDSEGDVWVRVGTDG